MTSPDVFSMLESPSGASNRGARESKPSERPCEHPRHAAGATPTARDGDDRALVARLLTRDADAWSEFVGRFERLIASRVTATCRELGVEPRPELLEECGAELMANLFHADLAGLRRFEGRSKLSTWLSVVTRRTALSVIRRRWRDSDRLPQPDDSAFDLTAIAASSEQAEGQADAEDRERLQSALLRLSESDRRVLELQFEQQLSYAAIGQQLGISENAVGPKLHRAQQRLKKHLRRRNET